MRLSRFLALVGLIGLQAGLLGCSGAGDSTDSEFTETAQPLTAACTLNGIPPGDFFSQFVYREKPGDKATPYHYIGTREPFEVAPGLKATIDVYLQRGGRFYVKYDEWKVEADGTLVPVEGASKMRRGRWRADCDGLRLGDIGIGAGAQINASKENVTDVVSLRLTRDLGSAGLDGKTVVLAPRASAYRLADLIAAAKKPR